MNAICCVHYYHLPFARGQQNKSQRSKVTCPGRSEFLFVFINNKETLESICVVCYDLVETEKHC